MFIDNCKILYLQDINLAVFFVSKKKHSSDKSHYCVYGWC